MAGIRREGGWSHEEEGTFDSKSFCINVERSSFLSCDNGCNGASQAVIDEMHILYGLCVRGNKEFSSSVSIH